MISWCSVVAVGLSIFCVVYFFIYEPYFKNKYESVEDQFVNLNNNPAAMAITAQPGSTVFTITFWMRVNKTNTKQKRIFSGVNAAGTEFFWLELGTKERGYGDATLVLYVNYDPSKADGSAVVACKVSENFPLNKPVFVTLVFDGLKVAPYLDSKLYDSINLPLTPPYVVDKLKLGGGESSFDCDIGFMTRYVEAWNETKIASQYSSEYRDINPRSRQILSWFWDTNDTGTDKYTTGSVAQQPTPAPEPQHVGADVNVPGSTTTQSASVPT